MRMPSAAAGPASGKKESWTHIYDDSVRTLLFGIIFFFLTALQCSMTEAIRDMIMPAPSTINTPAVSSSDSELNCVFVVSRKFSSALQRFGHHLLIKHKFENILFLFFCYASAGTTHKCMRV